MSQIDWSKAPEWANVFLGPACGAGNFAWAESFSDEARYMLEHGHGHNGRLNLIGYHNWALVSQRPAATVWSGTGLPPIGAVCEMQDDVGRWVKAEIIACHAGFSHGWHESTQSSYYSDKPEEFRPIRTPEHLAAEEREAAIKEIGNMIASVGPTFRDQATRLYDAGYRRQSTCDPTGYDD